MNVKVKYVEGSLMGQLLCSFKAEKERKSLLAASRVVFKLLSDPCNFPGRFLGDHSQL